MAAQYSDLPPGAQIIGQQQYSDLPPGGKVLPSSPAPLSGAVPGGNTGVPPAMQGPPDPQEASREQAEEQLKGIAKGPLSSIGNMGQMVGKIPHIGKLIAPPKEVEAYQSMGTPSNPDQAAGHGVEQIFEAVAPGIGGGGGTAKAVLPNAERAGSMLSDIATHAKDVPVMLKNTEAPLQRLTELGARGGKMPSSANSLLGRSQAISPGTFPEMRDYYSNIAGVARNELGDMSKPIASQFGAMKSGLHQDLTDAAATIGRGEDYAKAIREYAQAKRLQEFGGNLVKKLGYGAAGAAGLEGAYKGAKGLFGK